MKKSLTIIGTQQIQNLKNKAKANSVAKGVMKAGEEREIERAFEQEESSSSDPNCPQDLLQRMMLLLDEHEGLAEYHQQKALRYSELLKELQSHESTTQVKKE